MASQHDDGGSAFPLPPHGDYLLGLPGMSLLDYFAGQALAGYASLDTTRTDARIAKLCYDLASAMLAERERRASR